MADKFVRLDRLRFVARGLEGVEVRVFRDHKVRFGGNGAVAKFVVVRVGRDDVETKLRFDLADIPVKLRDQFKQRGDVAPAFRAGQFAGDFLIFEQDFGGDGQRQLSREQCAENFIERLFPSEDLQQDARVQADRHA